MSISARQASEHLIASTSVVALEPTLAACRLPDISFEDWDALFKAVQQRLRLLAAQAPAGATDLRVNDAMARAWDGVLDCVSALEQLHTSLQRELARRERTEPKSLDMRGPR